MESGTANSSSQENTADAPSDHAETATRHTAASSPATVRSPLLRQRRLMCSEDELSDNGDSDNTGNAELAHRQTKSVNCDSADLSNARPSHMFRTGSDIIIATSSLDVDGDSEEGGDLQRCGSSDITPPYSFSQFEDSISPKAQSSYSESAFLSMHCTSDYKESINLASANKNHTNQIHGQVDLKRSPKLEHKAMTRVKGMLSAEQKAVSEHPQCAETTRPAVAATSQHCKKEDASELLGVCTVDTVTLRRNEDESFGLNLEIMSFPLKVVITGLKPGGAAERVGLVGRQFTP